MNDSINYFAVAVSAVGNLVISYVWYMVFFKESYIVARAKTKEQMAKGPSFQTALVMQLVGNFALAFVLAWLIKMLGYTTIGDSLKLSFLIWLGFVAAVMGPMYAFEANSLRLFLINSISVLISIVVSAIVLVVSLNTIGFNHFFGYFTGFFCR
jgi:hypothetical protein